jgi:hypothetical protein
VYGPGRQERKEPPTAATLPSRPKDPIAAVEAFDNKARLAVRHIYDEDFEDPADVLALNARLDSDDTVAGVKAAWQPILVGAIERAFLLQHYASQLHTIRKAFSSAQWNATTQEYANLDKKTCKRTFKQLKAENADVLKVEVTIVPLGRKLLADVEAACEASGSSIAAAQTGTPPKSMPTASMPSPTPVRENPAAGSQSSDTSASAGKTPPASANDPVAAPVARFPAPSGSAKDCRDVREIYGKVFPEKLVRRVVIDGTWEKLPGGTGQVLHAIVATARKEKNVAGSCLMEDVEIREVGARHSRSRPVILIKSATSIPCDQLKG